VHSTRNLLRQQTFGGRWIWEVAFFLHCRRNIIHRLSSGECHQLHEDAFLNPHRESKESVREDRAMTWPGDLNAFSPFSFAFTFPEATCAIAGDKVHGCLSVKLHVRTDMEICSTEVKTNIGTILLHVKSPVLICSKQVVLFYVKIPLLSCAASSPARWRQIW
jgi:hypothetical protein